MSWRRLFAGAALFVGLAAGPALADVVRPVQIQITEREPGNFIVQWRVPKVLAPEAMPRPVMPDGCRPEGEHIIVDEPSGWLNRQVYRCPNGLAGQTIGIRYPIHNPSLTTMIRVELLSGERFAHAMEPKDESWQLPPADVGALTRWLDDARSAILAGAGHILGSWAHMALLLVLILLGGMTGSVRLVSAFAVGQLVGVACAALLGTTFPPVAADLSMAVAVMFLARESLRPPSERRRLIALAAGAGIFHGLTLATLMPASESGVVGWTQPVILVLGMDSILLVLALGISGVMELVSARWQPGRLRPVVSYLVGGTVVAAALLLVLGRPGTEAALATRTNIPIMPSTSKSGAPGSRRVAPKTVNAPIQSYVAVEPFEVRHEVLVKLSDVASNIDFETGSDGYIEVAAQDDITGRIAELIDSGTRVEIDGKPVDGIVDRVSFMTADATGVLPRQTATRETADDALVGVTIVYLTDGMPQTVTLEWKTFSAAVPTIPSTVIDPESSRSSTLSVDAPRLRWENALMNDPISTVSSIEVEPATLSLPLISLALVIAAAMLLIVGLRGRRRTPPLAVARILLALALLAGPYAQTAVALPDFIGSSFSTREARRVLARLLPNVYRALEFRDETAAYDRLAVSVTGSALTDVYLEHRRALEMEERGGARARVDAVELLEVSAVEPSDDGGFSAQASWTVGGTVTHFGHRHFRENRYDARVDVVPVDGMWKIRSIQVLELERVR